MNARIDDHAIAVAGIIVGDGTEGGASRGVAPDADLYSGAEFPAFNPGHVIQTLHKIATHPVSPEDPDVKVINMSYAYALADPISRDGNFELTKYIDWSAKRHDITYVIAGISDLTLQPDSPSENFNGITVAASSVRENESMFREVAPNNFFDSDYDAAGPRVSTDLMAPGYGMEAAYGGNEVDNFEGTSAAAPHVAGAVALLQEYGNYRIEHSGWAFVHPLRHEVMKAVLMNSADKITGIHGSRRTIVSQGNVYTWDNRPFGNDPSYPLDIQFGAGHLNVASALKQYRGAEWDPGVVPNIGWDYGTVGFLSSEAYVLNRPLAEGEVIAATLCWDRRVETISPNQNNHLDGFLDYQDLDQVLTDLDIWIQPAGADPTEMSQAVWGSISAVDNVEHVFFPVPFAGQWQIVVRNTQYGLLDTEEYGLAWWAGESIPGDFDGNGVVDSDDLPQWKTGFGTSEADADDDGDSDGNDFLAWQRNLGFGVPAVPVANPVPEPQAAMLVGLAVPLLTVASRRRLAACALVVGLSLAASGMRSAVAAEIVLTRTSRPVTAAEAAGGAPADAIVHDFYVTSDADLLTVAATITFQVYNHRSGANNAAPDLELAAAFPALSADSFFAMPSDTIQLGGGFNGTHGAWGDFTNDGPQKNFLFGRLTTPQESVLTGAFYLRGEYSPIELPFSLALPAAKESAAETLTVFGDEPKLPVIAPPPTEPPPVYEPSKPSFPQIIPTFRGPSLADFRAAVERKAGRTSENTALLAAAHVTAPEPVAWQLLLAAWALGSARMRRTGEADRR